MKNIFLNILLLIISLSSFSQCELIVDNFSGQIPSSVCAPVDLIMDVRYKFILPIDPSKIQILYVWNDGTSATTIVPAISEGDTVFTATAFHTYPPANYNCSYTAEAYVIYDGRQCVSSSRQEQEFSAWARDNQNGGVIITDPVVAEFCEGEDIVDVRFRDASNFNCNIHVEPDKPNRLNRWVQFIYGTQTIGGDRIPNITIRDPIGNVYQMTDNIGNYITTVPGPIIEIPIPADGPNQISWPISAPPGGVVGDIFEITLRNWNICNPYDANPFDNIPPLDTINGDNPPITTTALIEIIDTPDELIIPEERFCVGSDIILHVNTTGGNIRWYSDSLLTNRIYTGNNFNPSPTYVDNYIAGTYSFWVTESYGRCQSSPSKFTFIIFDDLVPDPPVLSSFENCGPTSVILTSDRPNTRWYLSSSGGAVLDTSQHFTTPIINATRSYWASVENVSSGCKSERVKTDVIIHEVPDPPTVHNYSMCGPGNISINATIGNNGNTLRWYEDNITNTILRESELYWNLYVYKDTSFFVSSYDTVYGCESTRKKINIVVLLVPNEVTISGIQEVSQGQSNVVYSVDYNAGSTYFWNIPYGVNALLQSQNYLIVEYPNVGVFNISVLEQNSLGCFNNGASITVSVKDTILPPIPITIASFDPIQPGCIPLSIQFVNTSENANTYLWQFGDGYISNLINPEHTYYKTGEYEITLIAWGDGGIDTFKRSIQTYSYPQALFDLGPYSARVGEPISFFNYSVNADYYNWDFGDNTFSNITNPTHSYFNTGYYDITLYAFNRYGCSDTTIKKSVVYITPPIPKTIANFSPIDPGCQPLTIQLENTSENASAYLWRFGDGTTSSEINPTHTYYNSGKFNIMLIAFGFGGVDTMERSIEIYELPHIIFDVSPTAVYIGEPVNFYNHTINGSYYNWEFGDGEFSSESNPTHTYISSGSYNVTLYAWSEHDCVDSLTKPSEIVIKATGDIVFPNVFRPESDIKENRVFKPGISDNILEYHLMIFNRWGELIFESFNINDGWDGYVNGKMSKQDVYVWKALGKYTDFKPFSLVGDVTLLH
jgi:gliding motility-associated-like protein